VIRVDEIRDFDVLKQAAKLLEGAVSKLQTENSQLRLELALRDGKARPTEQTGMLEEELAKLRAMLFAPSSEKRRGGEADDSQKEPPAQTPKSTSGHGPTPQPRLPIQETTYEIDATEANCSDCGKPLMPKKGMAQESELITVVGVEFKLEKVTQLVYGCDCPDKLLTAPGPDRVIPGGRYALEFATFVAAQKYLDHMPLARLERMMDRKGLDITRATIWDQIDALAGWLEPSWQALHEYTLGADWVHCDETRWPMLDGPGSSTWWAWCLATNDAVFYDIHRQRSSKAAQAMLNGFEGVLITDGYSAYDAVQRAGPGITHAFCWAHVRRKFLEAEAAYPDKVQAPIQWIGKLFEIERELPKLPRDASLAERETICAVRQAAREKRSRPVIDELRQWAYDLPGLLPSTGLTKAVNYMLKLWPGLVVFLNDPRVPIHNNHAERELRGVVVGRKNHYGSKSKRGTVVAAIFYSLFESARLAGVDPEAYVLHAARRAMRCPGAVTLPYDLLA
jgi:transposase